MGAAAARADIPGTNRIARAFRHPPVGPEQESIAPVNPWPGPAGIHAGATPPPPGDRYQHYLRFAGTRLRFDAALESAYLQHRIRHGLPLLRVSLTIAL